MTTKKGMELSATFMVGLIMGIVLFILGLTFAFNIISGAEKIREQQLPDYFEIEAENCVSRGDKLCVPEISKTAKSGSTKSFGVIINNVHSDEEEKEFMINLEFSRGQYSGGTEIARSEINVNDWSYDYSEQSPIFIDNNDYDIVNVPLRPPGSTRKGTYVFNVHVCVNADKNIDNDKCPYPGHRSLYSPTHQITVNVD